MKRRRVTPRTAGGSVEASLDIIGDVYSNDHANDIAANLPRIPGLSIEHLPPFLHVLRVASKFFQTNRKTQPFTVVDWERLNNTSINDYYGEGNICSDTLNSRDGIIINKNNHKTAHDSIMNRMEAASNGSSSTYTASSNDDDRQRRFVQAVNAWFDDVQLHAKRRKRQQPIGEALATTDAMSATTVNFGNQQSSKKQDVSQPIPYSMFLYLWGMQQQHKRIAVRRSALFLSGLLLLRSKDCRFHIDQETHLAEWVSSIGMKIDGSIHRDSDRNSSGPNSNRNIIHLASLQKEAIALISHLVDKGFGRRYVKLAVAAKSLRHRCTASLLETSDLTMSTITTPGMANWRRLRDFALLHGRNEIEKVRKLLDRADEFLETLVPRIDGVRRPSPSTPWKRQSMSEKCQSVEGCREDNELLVNQDLSHHCRDDNINGDEDSSESENDDIDWEDGDEIEKNDTKSAIREQNLHLSAVERTMNAMEKTSGNTLFSEGRLEVDFDRPVDEECGNIGIGSDNLASNENKARRKLQKIVQKLSSRHLVRLSAWLDGLRNSDNLVLAETASLVSLSPANADLRLNLISMLSALKQDVSTVISSASRLNIQAHDGIKEARTHTAQNIALSRNRKVALSLEGVPVVSVGAELSNKRIPKKKSKQFRFRRIQINCKK